MPNDTPNDLETTATGLMDKVGTMLASAADAVQDFAAEVMGNDEETADDMIEGDAEAMDDDEDDMDRDEADSEADDTPKAATKEV